MLSKRVERVLLARSVWNGEKSPVSRRTASFTVETDQDQFELVARLDVAMEVDLGENMRIKSTTNWRDFPTASPRAELEAIWMRRADSVLNLRCRSGQDNRRGAAA